MARSAAAALGTALAAALTLAGCGGRDDTALVPDSSDAQRAAELVRGQYQARDLIAAGAFTWAAAGDTMFVMVDAQSAIDGLVQARADLWLVAGGAAQQVGRSDMMPSAAEFGAWWFEDLTGDGVPELFGYVADSAGVTYPVFIPGAVGALTEEIAGSAPGYLFATEDSLPEVLRGLRRACALKLWAEEPVPDSQPAGWRYFPVLQDGQLMRPVRQAPICD